MPYRQFMFVCFSLSSWKQQPFQFASQCLAELTKPSTEKSLTFLSGSNAEYAYEDVECHNNEGVDKIELSPSLSSFDGQTNIHKKKNFNRSLGSQYNWMKIYDNYNLLWSPGFLRKSVQTTLILLILRIVFTRYNLLFDQFLTPFEKLWSPIMNIMLPLLSSACCILQLALNLVALGCAGFNTVLGPIRPYFLGIFVFLSIVSRQKTKISILLLRWTVALLPEALQLWNNILQKQTTSLTKATTILPFQKTVRLEIPTMGCVACINTINSAIKNAPGVIMVESSLKPSGMKGGDALVRLAANSQNDLNIKINHLCSAIKQAGFDGCHLDSSY